MRNNLTPQDLQAEAALLGAILLEAKTFNEIKPIGLVKEDFYKDSHASIFEACEILSKEEKPITLITVRSQLEKMKVLEDIGGAFALVQITTGVNSSANALYDAARIKEIGLKAKLHDFATIMYQKTADPSTDVFELLDEFKKISEQNVVDSSLQGITAREAAFNSLKNGNIERLKRLEQGFEGITGAPTFSRELDLVTQGRHRKKLDVLGAPTGNGKSLEMVVDAYKASKAGYKSVIISLEMDAEELSDRLMSIESGITYSRITKQMYSDKEFEILLQHHTRVQDILENITIYSVSNLDIRKVENIIYKHKDESHTFYIDYIQLVQLEKGKQKNEGLGLYTKELKLLAMKYNANITILAQLNRLSLECKTKEELHERFIADSKQIADDADTIVLSMVYEKFGITADEFGNPTTQDFEHLVGFNLTKQRGGASHTWNMWADLGTANYKDDPVTLKIAEEAYKQTLVNRDTEEKPQIDNSDAPF